MVIHPEKDNFLPPPRILYTVPFSLMKNGLLSKPLHQILVIHKSSLSLTSASSDSLSEFCLQGRNPLHGIVFKTNVYIL